MLDQREKAHHVDRRVRPERRRRRTVTASRHRPIAFDSEDSPWGHGQSVN